MRIPAGGSNRRDFGCFDWNNQLDSMISKDSWGFWRIFGNLDDFQGFLKEYLTILKHFEGFSGIYENFEGFLEGFPVILKDCERFLRILKNFSSILGNISRFLKDSWEYFTILKDFFDDFEGFWRIFGGILKDSWGFWRILEYFRGFLMDSQRSELTWKIVVTDWMISSERLSWVFLSMRCFSRSPIFSVCISIWSMRIDICICSESLSPSKRCSRSSTSGW